MIITPKITEILARQELTVSAEIIPPRNGLDPEGVFAQVEVLKRARVDFIAVTHGAGGSLRGGTLPLATIIKEKSGVTAMPHLTCRDNTAEQLENTLIDHHYLGFRNVLALRGDPPEGMNAAYVAPPGGYQYAYELIAQMTRMNQGHYLLRPGKDKAAPGAQWRTGIATDFCIGAAAYPEHPDLDEGVRHLRVKQDAGAHFAITQMVFDATAYLRFVAAARAAGVTLPIIPGLNIVASAKSAHHIESHFRTRIPAELRDRLDTPDPATARARSIAYVADLAHHLLREGAPAVHFFVMRDAFAAADVIKRVWARL